MPKYSYPSKSPPGVVFMFARGKENGFCTTVPTHRVVVRIPVVESFGNWNLTGIFIIDTNSAPVVVRCDTELMLLPHRRG